MPSRHLRNTNQHLEKVLGLIKKICKSLIENLLDFLTLLCRLKRIQELKREHEAARREIEFKEDGTQGIQMLKSIIQELEGMVVRYDHY